MEEKEKGDFKAAFVNHEGPLCEGQSNKMSHSAGRSKNYMQTAESHNKFLAVVSNPTFLVPVLSQS